MALKEQDIVFTSQDENGNKVLQMPITRYENVEGILDFVYPIGSLYWSKNAAEPSILFGGTWERVKDTFILAAGDDYEAGSEGGEASHTLTTAEMPSHSHTGTANSAGAHTHDINSSYCALTTASGGTIGHGSGNTRNCKTGSGVINSAGAHTHSLTINSAGSGAAHNNMPPYVAYYCWERTA